MALTYSEFKDYITSFIWRQNDVDLANDLDKIIRMADAELNRKLTLQRREIVLTISPEQGDYSLPSDFYHIVSLTNLQKDRGARAGVMASTSVSHIKERRARTDSTYIENLYAVQRRSDGATLYLIGPFTAENPGSFALVYRASVPDYQTDDASWLEDEYLDLYLYSVLKHIAIYLREDERVAVYAEYVNDALRSAIDEDLRHVKFGGSPLKMQAHHHIPQTRRR